ncbi:MAG: hypothetical protein LUI14_10775 [Lachnospiraceae bacterium]|nr:hypothetical protein [Lachnospiraceae bacterium]
MNSIVKKSCSRSKTCYVTFSNHDGKQWSIPQADSGIALEIYEPSGIKGKILKSFFPVMSKSKSLIAFINGQYTSINVSSEMSAILESFYGREFCVSIFWGTPCVDQKITVQIYKAETILGYCKIGFTENVFNLFKNEKTILDYLNKKMVKNVPQCLALNELQDGARMFVQTTQKKSGAKVDHRFGTRQKCFLKMLFACTKQKLHYEESDFSRSLIFLKNNIYLLQPKYRNIILDMIDSINGRLANTIVEWGVCHRDFTPWNTCNINSELFVFDFEYAYKTGPYGIDRWHFYVQSLYFEKKYSIRQIANHFMRHFSDEQNDNEFKQYLLDIISLYIQRGTAEDINFANERAELLFLTFIDGSTNK